MNENADYSNREIDRMFNEIQEALVRIEAQTTKTNGRVTRIERILTVVGVAGAVTAIMKFPDIIQVIKLFL